MGTSRIFPLLFLVVSIFRNSIFSVANDNFGEKVFNFSNGHFRIFKIYKLERCIFLEILSFLKIGCSFGYPLDKKYSIFVVIANAEKHNYHKTNNTNANRTKTQRFTWFTQRLGYVHQA
jgi:hypothetical protein